MVFQDHKLLHDRPVADNVALPLIIAGVPKREIDKRVRAALDQVGLLGKEKIRPLELSTGEQQRVGIARAVVAKPTLLIADEPTGNLDPRARARDHEAVQALQRGRRDGGDRHATMCISSINSARGASSWATGGWPTPASALSQARREHSSLLRAPCANPGRIARPHRAIIRSRR